MTVKLGPKALRGLQAGRGSRASGAGFRISVVGVTATPEVFGTF